MGTADSRCTAAAKSGVGDRSADRHEVARARSGRRGRRRLGNGESKEREKKMKNGGKMKGVKWTNEGDGERDGWRRWWKGGMDNASPEGEIMTSSRNTPTTRRVPGLLPLSLLRDRYRMTNRSAACLCIPSPKAAQMVRATPNTLFLAHRIFYHLSDTI
jgi:hypothetical protein